jgi:hypothetical protein
MKKAAGLLLCLALVPQAIGQDVQNSLQQPIKRHSWEIGPEIFYHRYSENNIMDETGVMGGVFLAYNHRDWISTTGQNDELQSGWMFAAEGSYSIGQVDYDGQLQDGTPYMTDGIDNTIAELRLLIGWDSFKGTNLTTLYTGAGYRYWNDDSSFDPAGYERESNYLYLPLGGKIIGEAESGWSHGPIMEFDLLLVGEQKSHLSDVGLTDVTNRQNSGYGVRFSYRLEKPGQRYKLIIEPFFRYWHIMESEVSYAGGIPGVEPENETVELGARLIWRF